MYNKGRLRKLEWQVTEIIDSPFDDKDIKITLERGIEDLNIKYNKKEARITTELQPYIKEEEIKEAIAKGFLEFNIY
jgi:hypothetical protein